MKVFLYTVKIKNFCFLLMLSSFLYSCQDEQEFKIPVEADFFMDVKRHAVADSRLQFDGGYIIISSFEFEGKREQADEVIFEREYEQGLKIPFTSTQAVEAFKFQIPQGNYTSISIEFETFDDLGENNLVVEGSFKKSDATRYPLVLAMATNEDFEIEAVSYSNGKQIILKKEAPVSAYIKLNPVHWFKNIALSTLDEAELVLWNGEPTILISDEVNQEIFDIIEDRLHEAAEATFIY